MLQCSFCNREVLEIELLAGRCPQCGSVLVWNEGADDIAPAVTNAQGDPLTNLDVSHDSVNDLPPVEVATQTPPDPPQPIGPPPEPEDKRIRETMQPRKLSGDDKKILQTKWGSTVDTAANAKMTIKSGAGEYDVGFMRTVPHRGIQSPGEIADDAADYQLIDVIGEGGVGIVYAARQPSVDRTVAVKMLRPELAVEWGQRQKFLAEAVVTGDLDHPNIVPIHELGHRDDGALFYSMKRVSGTPWSDEVLSKSREENLEILMKVADAIAFAHARGVVHRDLKPENVMLGEYGEVMVMDWGIAMPTDSFHRRDSLMQSGELGGTPAYMAPELATGPVDKIGPLSDVYLLGGILYEIVTGLTPHTGRDVMHCVEAAAANEIQPAPESGELVNVALKAMATEPEDRYRSVQDFQNAIRNYQSHTESIALSTRADEDLKLAQQTQDYQDYARSLFAYEEAVALWDGNHRAAMGISAAKFAYASCAHKKGDYDLGISLLEESDPSHARLLEQLKADQKERDARQLRLKRMRRTVGVTLAGFVCVICVAMIFVWNAKEVADRNREEAEYQKGEAVKRQNQVADQAQKLKSQAGELADKNDALQTSVKKQVELTKEARTQRDKAMLAENRVKLGKLRTEYSTYVSNISLIEEKFTDNAFAKARQMLGQYRKADVKNWEWARLNYLANLASWEFPRDDGVGAVAFSPDGSRCLIGDRAGKAELIDNALRTGNAGRRIELKRGVDSRINAVAWSPDGRLVATAGEDGFVQLFNATDGRAYRHPLLQAPKVPNKPVGINAVRFSFGPAGRWLVAGTKDGSVIVWDIATGKPAHPPLRLHSAEVWDLDIDAAQSRIVTAGDDGRIILWTIDRSARAANPSRWIGWIGKTTKPLEFADFHGDHAYSVAFSPDGKRIASSGANNRVLIWDPAKAKPVDLKSRVDGKREPTDFDLTLEGHTAPARCVRFSRDQRGEFLVSGSDDNTMIVWETSGGAKLQTLKGHGGWVRSCEFANGSVVRRASGQVDATILSGSFDKTARLWRLSQSREVLTFDQERNEVLDVAFNEQSSRLAVARDDGIIQVYTVPKRTPTTRRGPQLARVLKEGHEFLATTAVFFKNDPPDNRRFLTGAMDGSVRVWNANSGTQLAALTGTGSTAAVALSTDERWIATAGRKGDVLLWDVARLKDRNLQPIRLAGDGTSVVSLAFSPDGRTLLSGDAIGRCEVWDYQKRQRLHSLNRGNGPREHSRRVIGLDILPDGKRAITASTDRTVKLWDLATGRTLRTITMPDSIVAFAMSPDGKLAAVAAATRGETSELKKDRAMLRLIDLTNPREAGGDRYFERTMITSLRFHRDGNRLLAVKRVAADADGRTYEPVLQEWKVAGVRMVESLAESKRPDVWTAAYTPTGSSSKYLTVGGSKAGLLTSLKGGESLVFGEHEAVTSVVFSPKGEFLASGGKDGWVKVWSMADERRSQRLPAKHAGPVVAMRFLNPAGDRLCTVGGSTVAFWKYDAARRMWSPEKKPTAVAAGNGGKTVINAAAFSTDGSNLGLVINQRFVETRDLENRRPPTRFNARGRIAHADNVLCLAVSADAKWIVTGSQDTTALIWQRDAANTWRPIARMAGHPSPVNSVDISPNRERVLTASDDRTAKLWDTRELAVGFPVEKSVRAALYQSDTGEDLKAIVAHFQNAANADAILMDAMANADLAQQLKALGKRFPNVAVNGADAKAILASLQSLQTAANDWEPPPGKAEDTDADRRARYEADLKFWRETAAAAKSMRRQIVGPEPVSDIFTLRRHTRGLTRVRFTGDGHSVITAGLDGFALIWPARNGK